MKRKIAAIATVVVTLCGIVVADTVKIGGSGGSSSSSTQYTEADTDTTISGTAMMWEDTSDTLRAVSAAKPLPVNVVSGAGFDCSGTAIYSTNTNGNTQLVAISGSTVIYVCGYAFASSSSTANTLSLVKGTGSACATNEVAITPAYPLQAAASTGPTGIAVFAGGHTGLKTAAGDALCLKTTAAQSAQVIVWYAQF